jgi:hypothetical protein
MKHTIEMEYEQVDALLVLELKSQFSSLKNELDQRLSDDYTGAGFFENDKDADCAEIQIHMDAVAKVLSDNMTLQDVDAWKSDEDYCITEQAAEIERLRAALQLIAAEVTGNKHHQAQFRQDTACEALETPNE